MAMKCACNGLCGVFYRFLFVTWFCPRPPFFFGMSRYVSILSLLHAVEVRYNKRGMGEFLSCITLFMSWQLSW